MTGLVVVEAVPVLAAGLVDVVFVLGAEPDEEDNEDADADFKCPLPLDVFWAASTAALSVGKPGFNLVAGSSSSVILSGFGFGARSADFALSEGALSEETLCLLVGGDHCLGVVGAEVTASRD